MDENTQGEVLLRPHLCPGGAFLGRPLCTQQGGSSYGMGPGIKPGNLASVAPTLLLWHGATRRRKEGGGHRFLCPLPTPSSLTIKGEGGFERVSMHIKRQKVAGEREEGPWVPRMKWRIQGPVCSATRSSHGRIHCRAPSYTLFTENRKTEPIISEWCRCPANPMTVARGHLSSMEKTMIFASSRSGKLKAPPTWRAGVSVVFGKSGHPSATSVSLWLLGAPYHYFFDSNGEIGCSS